MEKTRLEALLDCDRTIDIPSGLARRVLVALRDERALEPLPAPLRATRPTVARLRSRWIYALAAGVLVALGVAWWVNRTGARPEDSAPLAEENQEDRAAPEGKLTPQLGEHATEVARLASSAAPDAELLAALGVLEQWDLLMQGDVDVLLSTLDPAEPILLDDEAELPPAPVHEKEAEQPSKG